LFIFGIQAIALASVPLRVSIKFILDANGNRPVSGNLNTNAEVNAEVDSGNSILRTTYTEDQIQLIEFVDLSGVSQHFTANIYNDTQFNALRTAAENDPATYHWRTDSINIYINGGAGSARGSFPPGNQYILMNQWCGNTPSCILHEIGHNLNLMHTHEPCCTNQDECSDTITDNSGWTKDQVAQNNFGATYANLNASQKNQVDLVYNNVMSYHTDEPQLRLSTCQRGRVSTQNYTDRSWMLGRTPIHVNKFAPFCGILQNGSFSFPYCTLQSALNAGGLNNGVLVLEQGAYTMTQETINANVEIVTRSGASTVDRGVQLWILPVDLASSTNPAVAGAVKAAQDEDTAERTILREALTLAEKAAGPEEKSVIRAETEVRAGIHRANAIKMLHEAERYATGDEKLAVQLELAQRYRQAGNCVLAEKYYGLVATATDQSALREEALRRSKQCSAETNTSQ
jgi:hypothetical protein